MVSLIVKERVGSTRHCHEFAAVNNDSQLFMNEVVLGTAFGVIMGPHCAGVFDPRSWGPLSNTITLEVMRVVLATGLFAIGVELPSGYLAKHAKGLLLMVIPTMAFGWGVVACKSSPTGYAR